MLNSPASLGRASVSASQLVSFHDGYYNNEVFVGASGPQDPNNPNANLPGTVTISTTDNFLGLDIGSYFTPDVYQYVVNGESHSIDLTSGDISFIGFIDAGPISAAFAESGPDEFDIIHAYTSEVPEPSSWAMMIVGMGLVGGTMRRRKTVVRFA